MAAAGRHTLPPAPGRMREKKPRRQEAGSWESGDTWPDEDGRMHRGVARCPALAAAAVRRQSATKLSLPFRYGPPPQTLQPSQLGSFALGLLAVSTRQCRNGPPLMGLGHGRLGWNVKCALVFSEIPITESGKIPIKIGNRWKRSVKRRTDSDTDSESKFRQPIPFPKNTDTDKSDREKPETVFGIPKNSETVFIPRGHDLLACAYATSA
jgi:hypothetical protein